MKNVKLSGEMGTVNVIVGYGYELKPIVKSVFRHLEQTELFSYYSDCPSFNDYRVYGFDLDNLIVYKADALLENMLDLF